MRSRLLESEVLVSLVPQDAANDTVMAGGQAGARADEKLSPLATERPTAPPHTDVA
jgi:hypothetical protein